MDNTQRRKWDKDEFAAKAAERLRKEEEEEDAKRAKVSANLGIVVRQPLSQGAIIQRDYDADLRARIGQKQIVNAETGEGMGFVCKESGKVLRDSMSYLDHINGKKQQRALGLSMRVERSTLDQVQARFEEQKRKREAETVAAPSVRERVALAEEEEEALRAERKQRKLEKKRAKGGGGGGDAGEGAAGEDGLEGLDPEMAAMMGFGGFGGGKR